VEKILAEIGYDETRDHSSVEQTALEAFYVGPEDLTDQELRRQLGERLPPQLIPTLLQRVDSIPLTASGKVDEKALSREAVGRRPAKPFRAPEGPVEEYLVGVWQEELEAEQVGADDNFFELGGTSLTAMQVMLRLCREFDIDLPLESMFLHPSLGELATLAEETILADVADIPEADRQRLLEDPI
jgi:acyl carrier protein